MAEQTIRVLAPNREFVGQVAGIQFDHGKASFDREDNEGAYQYFVSAGYEVDGEVRNDPAGAYGRAVEPAAAAPGTPGNEEGITRGPSAKDAAVVKNAAGPMSDAFLPPTNAGEADPHGPSVVSPGLHAVPPAPIRPGEVFVDDVARQELEETDLARAVLVAGAPATVVATPFDPDANMGPLGLSDPGSVEMGIREAKSSGAPSAAELAERAATANTPPSSRDKVEAWRDFAVAQGADPEEAAALTKDQLVERFGA